MRLTDILQPECVKVPLEATSKQQAIFELVDLLSESIGLQDSEALRKAVWQREVTRTTGIGHGIAIPHGKCKGVRKLSLAVGKPRTPVDFDAIDNRPVDVIILLTSPEDQTGPHIQALAQISRLLTDSTFRAAIKKASTAEELYQHIVEHESRAAV